MTLADTGVPTLPVAEAWARYETIRSRLPAARAGGPTRHMRGLLEIAPEFDGFLFDSFGVLNVGETAIHGAAWLDALRAMGRPVRVLTNAASYTGDAALVKYRRMGLDVRRDEFVFSRDVTFAHLDAVAPWLIWGPSPPSMLILPMRAVCGCSICWHRASRGMMRKGCCSCPRRAGHPTCKTGWWPH